MSINEAIKLIREEERLLQIYKELQILKLKLDNAIKELDKADKESIKLNMDLLFS